MSRPFSFRGDHALKYGLEEAVAINSFVYWIEAHEDDPPRQLDGRTWVWASMEYLLGKWPFLKNERRVQRLIDSLVKQGVLLRATSAQRAELCAQCNRSKWLQYAWYALAEQADFVAIAGGAAKVPKVVASTEPLLAPSAVPKVAASPKTHESQHVVSAAAASVPVPGDGCALPRAAAAAPAAHDPTPDPTPLSPSAQLLHDTGWFARARCEALAGELSPEVVGAVIARSRARPDPGGFVVFLLKGIQAGTEMPPAGYVRRQKEAAQEAILRDRYQARERERLTSPEAEAEYARGAAMLAQMKARRHLQ